MQTLEASATESSMSDEHSRFVLEDGVRFSQSLLWQLQRRFYERRGVDAWRDNTIPHYITCNPFIATRYAEVVMAWLLDWRGALDPDQPIHLVELGAGSGRFGYLFLERFLPLYRRAGLPSPVRYVLTDLAERNLDQWRAHPRLRPYFDEGVLDLARFDAGTHGAITLLASGETLAAGTVANPMVAIANYFFDCVPGDVFCARDGALYEGLASLTSPQPEHDPEDPDLLSRVQIDYRYQSIGDDYYDDPHWNAVLHGYRRHADETVIRFPTAGLHALRALGRLCGDRLLLLTGDKGGVDVSTTMGRGAPSLVLHGPSFSVDVNYHAVAEYVRSRGGEVLHTAHRHASLNVLAFLLGAPEGGCPVTRSAYAESIERFGPDDFFNLKKTLDPVISTLALPRVLMLQRLSCADPRLLWLCIPALRGAGNSVSDEDRVELLTACRAAWKNWYSIGEDEDLAFGLGALWLDLKEYEEALFYFEQSLAFRGPDPTCLVKMGLCHYCAGDPAAALRRADDALALDPDEPLARIMSEAIRDELRAEPPARD